MKFRFLVAVLAVVIGGAAIFGGRATTSQAVAGGTIDISCPFTVIQTSSFTCTIGLGAMPDPVFGYQFVIIYDSPAPPSGTPLGPGTAMTVTSIVNNYVDTAVWGGSNEFCPPNVIQAPNPLLPTGYVGSGHGCVSLGNPAGAAPIPAMVSFNFIANGLGTFPVHVVTLGGGGAGFGTYTIDGSSAPHTNLYVCLGTVCSPTPFSTVDNPADPLIHIVLPPPDVSCVKTGSSASIVLGQPFTWTITCTNLSTTSPAPGVVVTDTPPGAYTVATATTTIGGPCTLAVSCPVGTLAPSPGPGNVVVITITGTMTGGSGTTVTNCANETNTSSPADPNPANNTNFCASVNVIPPAVAWSKVGESDQTFLCENGTTDPLDPLFQGCTVGGKNGTVSFEEVMTNQGDPNGLAAFEFTLHFDNLIFDPPTLSTAPGGCAPTVSCVNVEDAILVLTNGAAGDDGDPETTTIATYPGGPRTSVNCSMTIPQETQIHVACVSLGAIGAGPVWTGAMNMADVQLHIKDFVRGSLFPSKENGIVTRVDDTGTELANSCGQPLNDGTGFVVPGQTTECQGVPLLGILPGGLVADSHLFATIRRLEGDVNKDCSVTVADLQAEAARYGFGFGSLLYQIWWDLEPHTTGADGDIDIKDLQFVFGRFGSECTLPIPPQVPQTPVDP